MRRRGTYDDYHDWPVGSQSLLSWMMRRRTIMATSNTSREQVSQSLLSWMMRRRLPFGEWEFVKESESQSLLSWMMRRRCPRRRP